MTIITDNNTLLQFVPNVVTAVEGENTLFDKLRPQLVLTEQWRGDASVGDNMLSSIAADTSSMRWQLAASVIANEAFRRSIPSLDLILTPNGFGIVSNANAAPASKERVERLVSSLRELRDKAIDALLKVLREDTDWLASDKGQWLVSSYFVAPGVDTTAAKAAVSIDDRWDGFLELREKTRPIEQAIAERWIGQALTARLRTSLASDYNGASDVVTLARTIRQLILDELISGKRPVKNLDRCVNYIRNNSTLYPEWQSDPVAELFEDKWRFQNKKESAGYFF